MSWHFEIVTKLRPDVNGNCKTSSCIMQSPLHFIRFFLDRATETFKLETYVKDIFRKPVHIHKGEVNIEVVGRLSTFSLNVE